MERCVVQPGGQHVAAFGSQTRIGHRRDRDLQRGASGNLAVLRVVVRPFEIVELGTQHDGPPQIAGVIQPGELRKLSQRQVYLGGHTSVANPLGHGDEIGVEMDRVHQVEERLADIVPGHDRRSLNFLAGVDDHTSRYAAFHANLLDDRTAAERYPAFPGGDLECPREVAHPTGNDRSATGDRCGANQLMQQAEGRARTVGAKREVSNRQHTESSLEKIVFEPVVEEVGHRHGGRPQEIHQLHPTQPSGPNRDTEKRHQVPDVGFPWPRGQSAVHVLQHRGEPDDALRKCFPLLGVTGRHRSQRLGRRAGVA